MYHMSKETDRRIEDLGEELGILKIQVIGDPKDNDDDGLKGEISDVSDRLKPIENIKETVGKWVSGIVLALLIAASTYLLNTFINGNDDTSNNNNNPNVMDGLHGSNEWEENNDINYFKSDKHGN